MQFIFARGLQTENSRYIVHSIEATQQHGGDATLFNSLRNTNKDGTASTATGDQIAPKGYQREDHLDG